MKLFIGIDPGLTGGIAAITEIGVVHKAVKMPDTQRDILDVFGEFAGPQMDRVSALIERVSASPQMGVVSAFTFGKGYGGLLMALTAERIPFDFIAPIKWQNLMGCRTGGDKNISKARAQQLFPDIRVTHAIGDALIIAETCRRIHTGALFNPTPRKAKS